MLKIEKITLGIPSPKDKLEDMDISLNNIWFLGVRLVANTSNLNISKDIWKIVLLLSYYKNLGYWWPFAVGFMSLCLLVFKLEHFKKSHQKFFFHHLGFIAIFWKTSKTTQLWTSAITKPLDLQCIMRYLWKDNIQIFHLVPKEVMYVQRFGCKQVLKIMATSRTPSFMSDTSISSSLSLACHSSSSEGLLCTYLPKNLIYETYAPPKKITNKHPNCFVSKWKKGC